MKTMDNACTVFKFTFNYVSWNSGTHCFGSLKTFDTVLHFVASNWIIFFRLFSKKSSNKIRARSLPFCLLKGVPEILLLNQFVSFRCVTHLFNIPFLRIFFKETHNNKKENNDWILKIAGVCLRPDWHHRRDLDGLLLFGEMVLFRYDSESQGPARAPGWDWAWADLSGRVGLLKLKIFCDWLLPAFYYTFRNKNLMKHLPWDCETIVWLCGFYFWFFHNQISLITFSHVDGCRTPEGPIIRQFQRSKSEITRLIS